MTDRDHPDVEPSEEPRAEQPASVKGRQSFRRVRRELTEDELSTPAAQRLLLDELDRLDNDCSELKIKSDKYHVADRRVGILEEKLKKSISLEVLSSGAMAVGGLALGYAAKVWDTSFTGPILLAGGIVLLVSGIWAKAVRV